MLLTFFLPQFPTGHGLFAVIIVCKGALALFAQPLHVYLSIVYRLHMRWSRKGLDDKLVVKLKSKVVNHCHRGLLFSQMEYDFTKTNSNQLYPLTKCNIFTLVINV